MRRLRVFREMARCFGVREAVTVLWLWTLRQLIGYRSAVVYVLDLASMAPPAPRQGFAWEMTERSFNGALNGRSCYASSVSLTGFDIKERCEVRFAGDRDAYTGDCETDPEFRGLGVYPTALRELGARLRSGGRERLCLFVERDNLASIQGVRKAGFVAVAVSRVMRIPGAGASRRWKTLPGTERFTAAWDVRIADADRT